MKKINMNGMELEIDYSVSESGRVLIKALKKDNLDLQKNIEGNYLVNNLNNLFLMITRKNLLKSLPESKEKSLW